MLPPTPATSPKLSNLPKAAKPPPNSSLARRRRVRPKDRPPITKRHTQVALRPQNTHPWRMLLHREAGSLWKDDSQPKSLIITKKVQRRRINHNRAAPYQFQIQKLADHPAALFNTRIWCCSKFSNLSKTSLILRNKEVCRMHKHSKRTYQWIK